MGQNDPLYVYNYCRSGHFRAFKFLRISDFGTFHEVKNSRIFFFV